MKFKFEKLVIWQKAMEFGEMVHALSSGFPKEEAFNLTSQIRRAVDSVALNISEGSIGQTDMEMKRFLNISIRSLAEVVTCLYKASLRKYIAEEEFNTHYDFAFNLMNVIIGFRNKIS